MTGRSLVRIQVGPPDRRRERRSSSEVEQGTHKPLAAGSHPASDTGLAEVVKLVDTQSSGGCELLLVRVRIPPSAPFPFKAGYATRPRPGPPNRQQLPSLLALSLPSKIGSVYCSRLCPANRAGVAPTAYSVSPDGQVMPTGRIPLLACICAQSSKVMCLTRLD